MAPFQQVPYPYDGRDYPVEHSNQSSKEEDEPDERIEVRPTTMAQSESKVVISKRERKSQEKQKTLSKSQSLTKKPPIS
jgi:hypothetical protein